MKWILRTVFLLLLVSIAGCSDDSAKNAVYRARNGEPLPPETVVRLAAQRGDAKTLLALLDVGVSPYQNLEDDRSVLHHAAAFGQTDIVIALLDRGLPIDLRSFDRQHALQTPLYDAAENNHIATAKALLERGADVNAKLLSGYAEVASPYMIAAAEGHFEMCSLLLFYGAEGGYTKANGENAIIAALQNNKATPALISFLIDNGADPNAISHAISLENKRSALYIAAAMGNVDVYKVLVNKGADPSFADEKGQTPEDLLGR